MPPAAYTFARLFAAGEALFHTAYNGLDGVGSAVRKDGSKVSRFAPPGPRGPGSQACGECHAVPFPSSAGLAHSSVGRDKKGTTAVNVRSVTSLFGDGILQLLAQEMTEDLQAIRDGAAADAKKTPGTPAVRELASKGTSFGAIAATAKPDGTVQFDTSKVAGIDPDLVVRPMGWKGDAPMVRNITLGAAAGGMGMIGDEIVWKKAGAGKHPDVDGDGVGREFSVGDITAMTVYTAAQETPTELGRLAALGYLKAPSAAEAGRIEAGRKNFAAIGCVTLPHARHAAPQHALRRADAARQRPLLRCRVGNARQRLRPEAAVCVRRAEGRAGAAPRGTRRGRRRRPPLW